VKKKFTAILERKGEEFIARCQELPDIKVRGRDKQETLENLKAAIIKKLGDDGSDAGSASVPHPVRPPPDGPIIEFHEKPDA
jgi:predicted RNase H-like HicB family nuclease